MLALGNRNVRKGLGMNDFCGEREMEDMELEEGEAYSYHNGNTNNEYGDCIDPDVSLSYIDAKIQHVLGHFQKDFEGGVSAENLGTKFGGYGSFLENGERSPICDTPRSPPSSCIEDGSRNPVTPLSVPLTIKPRSAPVHSVSSSGKRAHAHDLVKQGGLPSLWAEHVNSTEREETKSVKLSDPRMLKVRIKVGSDNLSKQKKAAIYCGLGLDVSPSTSVDYSPSESEGMVHKPKDVVFESPMNILQIMTSSPVHENLLLSPLGDGLICFTLRETLSEHRMDTANAGPVCCHILANESAPLRDKRTVLDRKVLDSKEKIDEMTDLKSVYGKTSHTGNSASSQKTMEIYIDCEEDVSETLKLPLVSGLGRTVNLTKSASNDARKDKTLNGPGKEGIPESPLNEDIGLSGKLKGYSGKVLQDRKAKVNGHPRKNDTNQGGMMFIKSETHHTDAVESNNAKSAECHAAIPSDNLTIASRKVKLPLRGKAKFKGGRNDESLGADASRESLSGSSSATKSNKSVQLESSRSNSGREDVKLKDSGKSRNRYKEFFGDFDGEEDNQDAPEEVPADVVKEIFGAGKGLSSENAKIVKSISKKIVKSQKPTISAPVGQISDLGNKHDVEAATVAPAAPALMKEEWGDKCDVNGAPVAPAVPLAPAAPIFIEDWVCCDKCQKWRLLPPGKNPDDLPEKWVCSMLDWLPGLNRCSVSEEETRGAIMASLQVPLLDFQKTENLNCGGLGGDNDATRQSELKHTYLGPPRKSFIGKKKSGAKRMSFPNKDGPQFSDPEKKPVQCAKSRSLDDVKPIPLRNEADFEKPIKRESIGEKCVREEKAIENNYDGGNLRNSKSHKRRETDGDYVKSLTVKVNSEPRQRDNEDWRFDDSKTSRRVVEHSIGGVPALMGNNHELDEAAYMKTSKHDSAKRIQVSLKNLNGEGHVSLDGQSLDVGGSKERDVAAKKRKPKDPQEALLCLEGSMGHCQGSGGVFARDNENRKNKKQRMLKHEGKGPDSRKESSKIDKRGSEQIDQRHELGNQPSRWGINDVDSVQRKTRSLIPAAAASSSSKVCSSPKGKSGFQEMKGSPAESVSSSPIRSSQREKHNLVPRNPMVKEEDSQFVKIVSPRKYPDGDVTALANHFWTGRQEESDNAHYGFLGASPVPNPDENCFSASNKSKVRHSRDAHSHKGRKDSRESSSRDALGPSKTEDSDQCLNSRQSGDSHHGSESHSQKSGKGSSSRSRDRSRSSKHEGGRDKPNSSFYKSKEAMSLKEEGFKEGKAEIEDNVHDDGKGNCSAVELGGKYGRVSQSHANRQENKEEDSDALCVQNSASHMDNNGKFSTKHHYSKVDQTAERRQSLPSSLPGMVDSSGTNKVNEAELITWDAFEGDTSKFPGKLGGIDSTNRNCRQTPSMSNGNCSRETDARSPIRKDSSNQAANKVIKEGADLKHKADRFKNTDSSVERTVIYFQAVLKFLHGASLLESSKSDGSKHNDTTQSSTQVYASTAKLCEYCAYEYEKYKDMASAALAYKCMEVAYMKVVYSSSNTAGRDRVALQKAFKINLAGESPSSSVSDLDNVNNSVAMEKSAPKGGSSPNVNEIQCIIAQSREHLIRLFNFSQDVSNAMEASRKSCIAFTAASARTGDAHYVEVISCIRRALDFNFHDVQGLLQLVRHASKAIVQLKST